MPHVWSSELSQIWKLLDILKDCFNFFLTSISLQVLLFESLWMLERKVLHNSEIQNPKLSKGQSLQHSWSVRNHQSHKDPSLSKVLVHSKSLLRFWFYPLFLNPKYFLRLFLLLTSNKWLEEHPLKEKAKGISHELPAQKDNLHEDN